MPNVPYVYPGWPKTCSSQFSVLLRARDRLLSVHIAIQILYVHASVCPLDLFLNCSCSNRLCHTFRLLNRVRGHMTKSFMVKWIIIGLLFSELLLFQQVCFNYHQTWIIDAQLEPSCYDSLWGHMTGPKVT